MAVHERAKDKRDFCAVAARPSCGCSIGADYRKACEPSWSAYSFVRKVRGQGRHGKVFEAHHILCVASVGKMIANASGKGVSKIVDNTEWCINTKKNMLAMPLWGHTVQWYCNVQEERLGSVRRGPPPFADLPQHDWDHGGIGGYKDEVEDELGDVVRDLKAAGHDSSTFDLADKLDRLSGVFRSRLKMRGARCGGTHAAWNLGRRQPSSSWYRPFSMADTGSITGKGYPSLNFNDEVMTRLRWLARQLR